MSTTEVTGEETSRGTNNKSQRKEPPAGAADRGKTFVSDEVVSIIAKLAAEQVEGVHRVGSSTLRSLIGRLGRHSGVSAEVGVKEAAVDLEMTVDLGYPIKVVAAQAREKIVQQVEHMTGCAVVEVNITVSDVNVPAADKGRRQLQ